MTLAGLLRDSAFDVARLIVTITAMTVGAGEWVTIQLDSVPPHGNGDGEALSEPFPQRTRTAARPFEGIPSLFAGDPTLDNPDLAIVHALAAGLTCPSNSSRMSGDQCRS